VDVSLVIPAYNESANLLPLVEACQSALASVEGSHEIVIVDDGSTDDTAQVLSSLAAERPLLRTIHHQRGRNIGCHPSELEALKTAKGDVALFLPADLQILPSSLPVFLAAAEGVDIVASRRLHRADNIARRVASGANNRVERLLMGVDVHDAHSSMLLNRRTLDEVVPKVVSSSALIPAEILVRARQRGLRIAEVNVEHFPRVTGRQTGVSVSEVLGVQLDLLRLRRRLSRESSAAMPS
jgi:undecaprenyl-phosphate 4-deoxy-4-formamido-L-arabinose transferase